MVEWEVENAGRRHERKEKSLYMAKIAAAIHQEKVTRLHASGVRVEVWETHTEQQQPDSKARTYYWANYSRLD
jgi:hypothetical protein